jgi:hypothetical protein
LESLKKGKSLPQNVDDLFFKEGAPLQDEYNNLYRALFNKPEQYIRIIEALCNVIKGISRDEICKKTKIPSSGELTKKLKELENCGYIVIENIGSVFTNCVAGKIWECGRRYECRS